MIKEENGIIEMTSENGKYTCSFLKTSYNKIFDLWGIDIKKFVERNFKLFTEFGEEGGNFALFIDPVIENNGTTLRISCLRCEDVLNRKELLKEMING